MSETHTPEERALLEALEAALEAFDREYSTAINEGRHRDAGALMAAVLAKFAIETARLE